MRPAYERGIYENKVCYGIYDLKAQAWTLDCFDYPRLFLSQKSAEDYFAICKDYNPADFEIRIFKE